MPAKKGAPPAIVVDKIKIPRSIVAPAEEPTAQSVANVGRRTFLRRSGGLAGTALAAGAAGMTLAQAAPLAIPESNTAFGKPIAEDDYGQPSKFEAHVRRRRTDVLKN